MAHMLEATQQLLLDQCSDAIAIIDARRGHWPLLAANRACRALFPLAIADNDHFLSNIAAHIPDHDLHATIRATLATGEATIWHDVPLRHVTAPSQRDETTFWNWQFRPMRESNGKPEQLVLVLNETTAAHATTTALDAVIDFLPDGLLILDQRGVIVRENAAAVRLLAPPSPLPGRLLRELLHDIAAHREDGTAFDLDKALIEPISRGERRADARVVLGNTEPGQGERIVAMTAAPIRDTGSDLSGMTIVLRDLSARKRSEQERDLFLSLISHEIKSPLTSIKGFAQLALRAIEVDDKPLQRTAKHLRVIEQQAERIGHLIRDLSDMSRLQRGRLQLDPTIFDLVAIARTVVEQHRTVLPSHRLDFTAPAEPLIVRADPRRVEQILASLLTNAAKYSPHADRIGVTLQQQGERARLTVQDWGIGISAADQPRVFERFFRVSSGGASGLGLGLFIARQIAAQSNGVLTVESEVGQGSVFCLDLPLAQQEIDDE